MKQNPQSRSRPPARKPPRKVRDLAFDLDATLAPKLEKAKRERDRLLDRDIVPPAEDTSARVKGFQPERGANTRDAQIAICKIFGMSNSLTAAAISTPESPAGIAETSVLRRLSTNKDWIEDLVQWGLKVRRKITVSSANTDINASNLRSVMEKKLPEAWTVLEQAIDEGNLEMAIWVIEQVVGKANQPHTMQGRIGVEVVWKGRAELVAQEQDMIASENMLKMLPPADVDAAEAELVTTE